MLWNWHLDLICEYLALAKARKIRRLIFSVPPQSTKSRLVTIAFPCWAWLDSPHMRFMCVSYSGGSAGLSTQHSTDRRRVLESWWYQQSFPQRVRFATDQNQKMQYENTAGGRMIATSTTGRATGFSADVIICDDLINPKEAHSDVERRAAMDFLDGTLRTRLSNQQTGVIIIVEQRTHEEDTTGHAMKLEPGVWTQIKLPMEAVEDEEWIFPISGRVVTRKAGDPLWEARFPKWVIESMRTTMGTRDYEAQMQQEPSPRGGSIIKTGWFRYWATDPRKCPPMHMKPNRCNEVIISWDMAFKDEGESSYCSGQVWGAVGARRLLLDRSYGRMDFVKAQRAVKALQVKWPHASATIVEDKANGPAIIASLKDSIPGLIPWPPKGKAMGSKEARMFAVSPLFEAGNVELPDPDMPGYEWVREYADNIARFPMKPNDDGDATSQALERLKSQQGFSVPTILGEGQNYFRSIGADT